MSVGAVNKSTGERIPAAGMPVIDVALSGSSTNPVQNRVVKAALDEKADTDIVASDFDATASYTAGNYCIYEGKFYRFKTTHSGAWVAADVDEIKIAGELSALKSGLTNYSFTDSITVHGDWTPTSISDITNYVGKVIYGYMADATLGRTYTFAVPVDNMPGISSPVWVQHDGDKTHLSDSIFVAKMDGANTFGIYLGVNIPDMTLYLFVH